MIEESLHFVIAMAKADAGMCSSFISNCLNGSNNSPISQPKPDSPVQRAKSSANDPGEATKSIEHELDTHQSDIDHVRLSHSSLTSPRSSGQLVPANRPTGHNSSSQKLISLLPLHGAMSASLRNLLVVECPYPWHVGRPKTRRMASGTTWI
jgi:hypothetical protein